MTISVLYLDGQEEKLECKSYKITTEGLVKMERGFGQGPRFLVLTNVKRFDASK